ncbi:MAG: hypothetical protein HFI85_04820 [Clostridia bacterium]|jgi:hypothetical protein|nr:hypothetical protein [Clostridia bacterium]
MFIEHEVVYDLITTMQKQKGAIRVPLSLQEYIFNYLKETYPKNKMNGVKAKNAALVFGLLANEFYLINQNREPHIKEFFMTKARWVKINAGQVMIETALKLLKEMKLIDYYNVPTPGSPYQKTRIFRIGCITLSYIATIMEEKCKKEDCLE